MTLYLRVSWGHKTVFTNIPCLDKTTFPNNHCISGQVDGCKEDIGDFLFPAVVTVCEVSRKWHVKLVIWYMAESTAHGQVFFKPR